ncbi:MAG: ABC transporter permease [Bacillota bacterium]
MQINPIIEKELKTKMRGWKAPALISVYLGFLLLVIILYFIYNDQLSDFGLSTFNPRVAINAYNTVALFQLLLLLFITPAMTGGAVSSERERQTLDLLLCTNFSTYKVILGKIFVSIAHIMLLITASLPLMAIVFLFGGVSFTDIMLLFLFYIATAVMLGSIGTFYSTVFKKTIVAIVITYLTVLIITIGTVVLFAIWGFFVARWTSEPAYHEVAAFLFSNPFFGFGSVIEGTASNNSLFGAFVTVANAGDNNDILVKSWMVNIGFYAVLSTVLIFVSAWRIKRLK